MYIISRCDHAVVNSFMIRPMNVPPNTPTIVRIVNRFSLKNAFHFELLGIFWMVMNMDESWRLSRSNLRNKKILD